MGQFLYTSFDTIYLVNYLLFVNLLILLLNICILFLDITKTKTKYIKNHTKRINIKETKYYTDIYI